MVCTTFPRILEGLFAFSCLLVLALWKRWALNLSIRRIPSSSPASSDQFEIDVHGPHVATDREYPPETTTFITLGLISDYGANAVKGRDLESGRWSDPHGSVRVKGRMGQSDVCHARAHVISDEVLERLGLQSRRIS